MDTVRIIDLKINEPLKELISLAFYVNLYT